MKKIAKPKPAKLAVPFFKHKDRTVLNAVTDRRWLGIICLALIVLVGVLCYSNSLNGAFVFDDLSNITDDNAIRSFGDLLGDLSFSRIVGNGTFALNYRFGGLDVTGYHVFNLAAHLSCALLVFWFVTLTLKTPFFMGSRFGKSRLLPISVALFSSLVFVSHPLQTQAVTYTVQRFTSLATLFYLLTLVMYAKWRLVRDVPGGHSLLGYKVTVDLGVKKAFFCTAAIISALLAMLTKEIAFTLPVVLALWEFSFLTGPLKKRLLYLLPFALTLPLIPLVLMIGEAPLTQAEGIEEPPPVFDYFLTQLRVIVTYMRLMVLPLNQNLDYDYPIYSSPFDPNVFLSFVLLLTIVGLGAFLWRHSKKGDDYAPLRLVAFGIFWFFITLSVESSFITIADVIFEHRLYLPSVGLIITAVAAITWATLAFKERLAAIGKAAAALGAVVVVVLAVATFERNRVWADPVALWEDTAAKSPGKARPHNNLGVNYQESGQLKEAEREFIKAIELDPDDKSAYYNLGMVLVSGNRFADAIGPFIKVIELDPGNLEARINLGNIYAMQGRYNQALAEYQEALAIDSGYQEAKDNIQLIYRMQTGAGAGR